MSLLRTAQASPTRKRSGKVSALRAKFENMSGGQSNSFRSNSILGGSATTVNTDPELKRLVHDATKEVLNTHGESLSFDGDQSINSFMRTLSGSGSSSFSVSKAFHAVKRKMHHQKGGDGSVNTPPPLLEVQKNNSRKVSLGGNLQMDFNFTMPIDRVHVQNAQQPSSPTPHQDSVTPKAKKEAYAKAEKMLAKLDEKQKHKAARAKQMMLELKKQTPQKSSAAKKPNKESTVAKKANKVKVVKVTQVAEDTSTIDNSQASASLNVGPQRAGTQNQKQRLLDRLEKMGLKPLKVSTGASRVSEPPSIQSSVYTSNSGIDPDGYTASSLGPQDPSGFVVSYNPDDATARSGSSSRSNEENLDPTSPRSARTPKSTNRSTARTMNFDESDLKRDSSNIGSLSSYPAMSEPQISTRVSDDVTSMANYPHQNHFEFENEDNCAQNHFDSGTDGDNDDYSIASVSLNPHGDDVAADIAQTILGGFETSMTSNRSPDTRKQKVETIRSFDQSVQVVSDGGGENFEAVHVDETNPYDDEDFEDNASSGQQPYLLQNSLNENFVSNHRSSTYANEIYDMDRAMMYPEDDDERSSGSSFDRYAIDGGESLNDVMDLAADRLSAPDHPNQNPSYTDTSFGMEDILNMAASRLGGSAGARGASSFSFDSMMEFATGRLNTTPKASVDATAFVNASEKRKFHQPEDSLRTLNSTNGRDDTAASSWVTESKAYSTGNLSTPGSPLPINATRPMWQKSAIEQSERASHSADWSVEPGDEVFIDLDTDEPHTPVSTRLDNFAYPNSQTSVNDPSPRIRVFSQTKPPCPSPESPRPAHPVKAPETLLAASRGVVRPKLPSRSQFKETIDPPPAEAFNHPIPIQMSPGKSLFDDLSHSMAPSSMSDSISALTPDGRRGMEAKLKGKRLQTTDDGEHKSTTHRQDDALLKKSDVKPAAEAYQEKPKENRKVETEEQSTDPLLRSDQTGAFCSLLGGKSAPTSVAQADLKMKEHFPAVDEGKSPYKVDQFPGLASVELATPPSSPTNAVAAAKQGFHKRQPGPNASESLLNDDDEYWDTLSSIATDSLIRSQKNFEEVSRPMGADIYPLSPVDESSLEVESGCVCPWNEHLLLPRDHPDYTGPQQHKPVFDVVLNASSTESIDVNIPVEISYLPDITGMMHLAKEPQPSLAGSENVSASLGNLRSILTASSSSSSESSLIHSNGRSLDDNGNSAESFKGSYKGVAAGSDLQEAIKRGEVQAFVDSPKMSDTDRGFVEQKHSDSNDGHLADSVTGPPPLPTLLDTEIRSSIAEQSENSRMEKNANVFAADYSYTQSTQEFLAEFEAALDPRDRSEMRGGNQRMFPVDETDKPKPLADMEGSLNALNQLLSEDKTEDSYNSFDDEHYDDPDETALFVTRTRSTDRQNLEDDQELPEIYQGMISDDDSGNDFGDDQGHEEQGARPVNKSAESDIIMDEDCENDDENPLLLAYSKSDDRMERNHPSMTTFSTGSAELHTSHAAHDAYAQFDAFDSQDDIEVSDIHRATFSVDHSEKDDIDLLADREREVSHLNAISQLLSEDKTEESNFGNDDCDDNSENTHDLLLALSRSNDRLDRNDPFDESSSPSNIMDYAPTGVIDTYLEATAVDGVSPDDSLAAVGGSPKRRKMKEGMGTAAFDSDSPVTSTHKDVRNPEPQSSDDRPLSPSKQKASPEPFSNAERPLSPTKQRPPSPEVNLSPLELLMEEAEILLSKGLHNRPAPRVTSSSVSPPKYSSDQATITANVPAGRPSETSIETPGKSMENPSSPRAVSPTKNRFGALMMPTVSSMLCSSTAIEYESIDALSPLVSAANDSEKHRGRVHKDYASSNDPAGDISRIPSPEKARFPSPERAAKRLSPLKGRPPSPEKSSVEVSRKNSPEQARFSSPEKAPYGVFPVMERPSSPEKAPRIYSPQKERLSSPEMLRRNHSVEKERRPSPGITPISPARLQRVSPRRRPPTPERQVAPLEVTRMISPGSKRAGEYGKSSEHHKDDIAVTLRSRRNLVVETNELEPAYSFDKDKQGRKTLGRSPRLESVLARVQLRRQEKMSRQKQAKDVPTMEETLEEYDAILDQLMRQNKTLKRGGKASETSLGSDSDAIKERIIDLRLKTQKAMTSIPQVVGEESPGSSTDIPLSGRQRQRSPLKAHTSHASSRSTTRGSRSVSPVSSAAKLESGLRYRAETHRVGPSKPRPPTPESAVFSRSPVRSRSVPTSRDGLQGHHEPYSQTTSRLLNESVLKASRVASYSERAREVFSPGKEREELRQPPEASPKTVDATVENKYQRLAQDVFTPTTTETKPEVRQQHPRRSFIDKRQTRISSPPRRQESRNATSPKKTPANKWDEILNTKSAPSTPSGAGPVSKTPYMDRLLRERGYTRPAYDSMNHASLNDTPPSDARNPSPAQRESPWRESRLRSSGGAPATDRKEERQQYSPLRRQSALKGMDPTLQQQQPISSPERRRLLGSYISDQTQQLKRDLDLARLSSHKIRKSNVILSSELEAFKHKLSQHARSKAGERAIIGACQYELGGFQQRLQEVTRGRGGGGGRGSTLGRNDSFMSDITLETAWEDFSEIRNAMLTNLKLMHDAQERLMRERFRIQEHDDQDAARLMEIQDLMATIQRQEKYDSNMVRMALEEAERLG